MCSRIVIAGIMQIIDHTPDTALDLRIQIVIVVDQLDRRIVIGADLLLVLRRDLILPLAVDMRRDHQASHIMQECSDNNIELLLKLHIHPV